MQIVNSNNSSNISFEETNQTINLPIYILSVFLICFCLITVFGNALVIYAVIQERYLKSGISQVYYNLIGNRKRPEGSVLIKNLADCTSLNSRYNRYLFRINMSFFSYLLLYGIISMC